MHKSFSNKSKQDFDTTVDKFRKQLESSGTDLARVMLDVGKITEEQKLFVENSRAKIIRLEENFENTDQKLSEEIEKSEKEFQEMNGNLSERRREIGALQVCLCQSSALIATGLSASRHSKCCCFCAVNYSVSTILRKKLFQKYQKFI